MDIAINAYGCGRGGKCDVMFRYILVYAGVREMKIQIEKGSRNRAHRTSSKVTNHRIEHVDEKGI